MCVYKESVFLFGGRANKKIFNDLREMQGDRWTQIVCET
jgi:hypothetical protein